MFSKTPHVSYPGELPDLDHRTISLRAQLRLSYETYGWLRYLTWSGLLLLAVLLLLLPGGFPPRVAILFWQTLLIIGHLMALHGPAALFSLLALGAQTLTWLVLWGILIITCYKLGRYTWQMYSAQKILADGWLSSSSLSNGGTPISLARTTPLSPKALISFIRTTPLHPKNAPDVPVDLLIPRLESATPASAVSVRSLSPVSLVNAQPVRTPTAKLSQTPGRSQSESASQVLVRSLSEPATSSRARQFAQPNVAPVKPRPAMPSSDIFSGWPLNPATSSPGIVWDTGITRKGRPNEDSVFTMRGTCNFSDRLLPFELHIIADGMGGHAQGRLASHLAIRSMLETVVPGLVACNEIVSEQIIDILIDGVHWANQVIYQYGQEHNADMGTTITAVLLLDEAAYIINVGDSRTYIYRPGVGLTQITRDHSLVARLVETGAITPDEVYTHPDRNKVYRGLGDKSDITVDWFVLPVQSNDLLLLCSDGLWEMVRDPKIAEILQAYANSPTLASSTLLRAALQAGGNDNVSSLVVRVQS